MSDDQQITCVRVATLNRVELYRPGQGMPYDTYDTVHTPTISTISFDTASTALRWCNEEY